MTDSRYCCKSMIVSPLKISLIVVSGFLLCTTFVSAQQEYRTTPGVEVPRVTLSALPASVVAGRPVRLVAQLSSGYPNIRFRFAFGDGTQSSWQTSTVATHSYSSPGKYLPFVDIGVATGSGVTRLGGSVRRPIQVTHAAPGPVELYMTPATPEIGRPVTLSARTASSDPNLRYRFAFGDGSPVGGWQSSPHATHVYRSGSDYSASIEVAVMTNRGLMPAGSSRRAVTVTTPVGRNRTTGAGPAKRDARGGSFMGTLRQGVLLAAAVLLLGSAAAAQDVPRGLALVGDGGRSGFWLGFGLGAGGQRASICGTGWATARSSTARRSRSDWAAPPVSTSGSAVRSSPGSMTQGDATESLSSFLIVGQFYPVRGTGLYLKGGLGLGRNALDFDDGLRHWRCRLAGVGRGRLGSPAGAPVVPEPRSRRRGASLQAPAAAAIIASGW